MQLRNSFQINVGNIICVKNNENFPCDLLLLATSSPTGKASIMTANLDGETNLKVHNAPKLTRGYQTPDALARLRGVIECENPNADLHRFLGRLKIYGDGSGHHRQSRPKLLGLTQDNIVLRGTKLQNTDFVYGCAVYTGEDTKMSRNSKLTSNKFSTVERSMNKYLVFFLILLFLEITLATVLKYHVASDRPGCERLPWYYPHNGECVRYSFKNLSQDVLSFLVLFNYIIPISLYVTLEMQKFIGSMFLAWDIHLYDEEMNQPAKSNSSDLNEELGQVRKIKVNFS